MKMSNHLVPNLSRNQKLLGLIFLIIGLLLYWVNPAAAQSSAGVWISSPDTGEFPDVTLFFEPYSDQGGFIAGLQSEDVTVIENGTSLPAVEVQQFEPGLQIILALNVGPVMENHTAGVTNYDRIRQVLQDWALSQPFETPDSLSLVTNSGPQKVDMSLPADWDRALDEYQPDMLNTQPSLTSLSSALDLAVEAAPNSYSKRTIFYITQSLTEQQLESMPALTSRATQQNVRVFTWLVALAPDANPRTAEALAQLSRATGGQYMLFSGPEELPDLETYLRPLRYIYYLKYTSAIQQSGVHNLILEINRQDIQAASEPQSFELTISPPNPMLLSPPVQVVASSTSFNDGNTRATSPFSTIIESMIEFPDGHSRGLRKSSLYVDGVLVAENTIPPFDRFEWKLEGYNETGVHQLRVEVVDTLGLKGSSIDIPVEVIVEPVEGAGNAGGQILIGAAVLVAAIVLLIVLVLAGKRTIPSILQARKRKELLDPVTQPVRVMRDSASEAERRAVMPKPLTGQGTRARLVRVSDSGRVLAENVIYLSQAEVTLGSDPNKAIRVLDSPSVSGLHARMQPLAEGSYLIADAGSVAGTWVNYAPVSTTGARLLNGDLIHFGRMAFRFESSNTQPVQDPQVTLIKGSET
jgi:hypothetical protein